MVLLRTASHRLLFGPSKFLPARMAEPEHGFPSRAFFIRALALPSVRDPFLGRATVSPRLNPC